MLSVSRASRSTRSKLLPSPERLPRKVSPSLCHSQSSKPLGLAINHICQVVEPGDPRGLWFWPPSLQSSRQHTQVMLGVWEMCGWDPSQRGQCYLFLWKASDAALHWYHLCLLIFWWAVILSVSRANRKLGELLHCKQSEKKPRFRNSLVLPRMVGKKNIPARQIAQGQDVGI